MRRLAAFTGCTHADSARFARADAPTRRVSSAQWRRLALGEERLHPGAGGRPRGGWRLHVGGDPRDGGGVLGGEPVPVALGLDERAEVGAHQEDAVAVGARVHLSGPERTGVHLGAADGTRPGVVGLHAPTVPPRLRPPYGDTADMAGRAP